MLWDGGSMKYNKIGLLNDFRCKMEPHINTLLKDPSDVKLKAKKINPLVTEYRNNYLSHIYDMALHESWSAQELVNQVLLVNYIYIIVMLESRNSVWLYDYMAFSRRIGELWEPFCKIAFFNPIKSLTEFKPMAFEQLKTQIQKNAVNFINSLLIIENSKEKLINYYNAPWGLIDSEHVKLELDLHFIQDGRYYNCDFKSGFSSNEKGNTNRLLLVGSIYSMIGPEYKNILFVRQNEEDNNHYLMTLKESPYWNVYCADECYLKIKEFTGVDLRTWMDQNMNWKEDISKDLYDYLIEQDLFKYLTW